MQAMLAGQGNNRFTLGISIVGPSGAIKLKLGGRKVPRLPLLCSRAIAELRQGTIVDGELAIHTSGTHGQGCRAGLLVVGFETQRTRPIGDDHE